MHDAAVEAVTLHRRIRGLNHVNFTDSERFAGPGNGYDAIAASTAWRTEESWLGRRLIGPGATP